MEWRICVKTIQPQYQVSPYFVFYIIVASQVGVGILSFQRDLAKEAGYDGWISVLITGCIVQVLMFLMYKLVSSSDGDLIQIHQSTLGRFVGNTMSIIFMLYFGMLSLSVLRSYIEIVQVWLFPTLPTWLLSFLFMLVAYYVISGGFRVVVGLCFFSVIFPLFSQLVNYIFPYSYFHLDNLLPVMDHSLKEIFSGVKGTVYTLSGFEVILMVYPFIRKSKPSQKYAHLAILSTTLLYTISTVSCFLFFSEDQLLRQKWPELTISKLIHYSFLERFEYVYISMYLVIILSIISLLLWCSSRGFKLVFGIKQRVPLLALITVCVIGSQMLDDSESIASFRRYTSYVHVVLVYLYLPLLWMFFKLREWRKKHV